MVDILVATYNGEKYILAQLLSLLFQSYREIRILVHDDGSTDSTREIVNEIATKDNRVRLVEDGITLGSASRNFMHLLKYSSSDVVMFCDQDDIWFDNKIDTMLSVLKEKDSNTPQALFSESYVWEPEIGIEGIAHLNHPKILTDYLFLNSGLRGCCAMFNKPMRDLMLRWQGDLIMHDYVLGLLALTLGEVSYVPQKLMLYRRHKGAVTAEYVPNPSLWNRFYENRHAPVIEAKHYETASRFLEIYGGALSEVQRKIFSEYLKMKDASFSQQILSVLQNRFRIRESSLLLLAKLILRPHFGELHLNTQRGGGQGL